jgi:hypothetical protein
MNFRGPDSSVGIATGYGLDGPGIESRGGGGARFRPHRHSGPGGRPAARTNGSGFFYPGVKRLGRGAEHPPPTSAEVENE